MKEIIRVLKIRLKTSGWVDKGCDWDGQPHKEHMQLRWNSLPLWALLYDLVKALLPKGEGDSFARDLGPNKISILSSSKPRTFKRSPLIVTAWPTHTGRGLTDLHLRHVSDTYIIE